jgi:uncharacterized protein
MDFIILISIGLAMGFFGGLLGIGGSVVMIPAVVFAFGENQHLYQAAAMICNFLIASASFMAHQKAKAMVPDVLKWLIPAAFVGIISGVTLSNLPFFAGRNSVWLARIFGIYSVYVAGYYIYKWFEPPHITQMIEQKGERHGGFWAAVIGLITGLGAGLLGIGAGTVATPLQQLLLRLPLTRSMSNSAVTIMSIAWLGAIYKNATLASVKPFAPFAAASPLVTSLKLAALIAPTAILGGFLGAHMMHRLPKKLVRFVFLAVVMLAAIRLLTVKPAG